MSRIAGLMVVMAVIAVALAGVHEQGENRRLRYQVWEAMRRRDALDKQIRELEADIASALSARSLLEAHERQLAGGGTGE